MSSYSRSRTRRTPRIKLGLLGLAAACIFLTVPSLAVAHTKQVTLAADQPFRGYQVRIIATKQDPSPPNPSPVGITIVLRNDVQVHRYSFQAPRRSLVFGQSLSSGELKLGALSTEPLRASRVLASYGGGTIRFAATGPMQVESCSGGRATQSRNQARTSGHLRFRPAGEAANEFVREDWIGAARKFIAGGCAELPPCRRYTRLLANGPGTQNSTFSILAWRYDSAERVQVQAGLMQIDPEGPPTFVTHDRTAYVARSRFTATGLAAGSLDLEGVPGLGGSLEIATSGDANELYSPCPARWRGGTATGSVQAAFAFAPDQDVSTWDEGTVYRTQP